MKCQLASILGFPLCQLTLFTLTGHTSWLCALSIFESNTHACYSNYSATELLHKIITNYRLNQLFLHKISTKSSNWMDQNHQTRIIIGAVTGSLVTLLIIFGGSIFLFIHRLAPNLGNRSQETSEQNPEEMLTEDEVEGRNIINLPLHADTSGTQVSPQQEVPQAALGNVVAEVVRLRAEFQQFMVEHDAERVHGDALDPPPAYK
ncbi:hypothetical protein EDD18DRAFT_1108641 [Armillaria luteobubalina]|uniref:Uncharacterized protein n=1 Tax=Armillaria luteobubalina TaxID=153913 RepID=A0AA39PXZ9_9AGAR|nr:hypothetical protein EDD18DRAFT_1108641 [Armillaria luteobubalina]